MRNFLDFVSLVVLSVVSYAGILMAETPVPSFIHVCSRNDPNLKSCMIEAIEALRPYLKSGLPEYNIPSVEPIIIKDLIKEEAAGLKVTTTDVEAYGGGDYTVTDVDMNVDNYRFEINVMIPLLRITAKYAIDGKLVLVPIRGNGDFFANLTDIGAKAILQGELFDDHGDQHLRFKSNIMKVKVGGGKVKLENLFGGDGTLSEIINDTINKNLDVFIKELMPYIEKGLASNFLITANKIIEPYGIKQLLP